MRWTREALAARVDTLGPGAELEAFAENLDDDERAILQELLLERSGGLEYAVRERFEARGWLRRTWDRADPGGSRERRGGPR
jgi:hypothetical protein